MRRIFISYLPTPGSQIYKDAVILSKVVQSKAADCVTALAGRQSSGGRQVFSAEIAATKYESDEDHDMKDDYPDCHEIISEPIDMNIIENKIKTEGEDETRDGFSIDKVEASLLDADCEVQIEDDTICQLDGAADPVTCNICKQCFDGINKGLKLTPHKINFHFKDEFRRAVRDKSKIDSNFHCKEDNCTATFKQKADMFRHLDKFSNTAATTSLSPLWSRADF